MPECKKCGEPIIWKKTEKGKNVMLDPEPSSAGTYVLEDREGQEVAVRIRGPYTGERFTCHWDTCEGEG